MILKNAGIGVPLVLALGGSLIGCHREAPGGGAKVPVVAQLDVTRDSAHAAFDNLVLIVIDTLRSDHLPGYGYERETAPFLARLGREGVAVQGYSSSSWTRPSMATLFSGLHPQEHQVVERGDGLPAGVHLLGEVLKQAGFTGVGYSSNLNAGSDVGFAKGFARFHDHSTETEGWPDGPVVTTAALRLLEGAQPPYLFYVHYIDPHDPYIPKVPWGGDKASPYLQPTQIFQGEIEQTPAVVQRMVDQYDGEILEVDGAIETLLAELDRRSLLERTLVVVTSDHGEEFGEHGSFGHGQTLYEESIAVPLIFWSKDWSPDRSAEALPAFHHVDLLPTILEALGVEAGLEVSGRSRFEEIARGEMAPQPRQMYFHLDLDGHAVLAVRDGDNKLIHRRAHPRRQLFDLSSDPGESAPLLDSAILPDLLDTLIAHHNSFEASAERRVTMDLSVEQLGELRALGYIESDTPVSDLTRRSMPSRLEVYDSRINGLFGDEALADLVIRLRPDPKHPQTLGGWGETGGRVVLSPEGGAVVLGGLEEASHLHVAGELDGESATLWVSVQGQPIDHLELSSGRFQTALELPEGLATRPPVFVDFEVSLKSTDSAIVVTEVVLRKKAFWR